MDTRDKRASAIGLGLAALLILPSPGTLDQGDRQQTAYSYRGILSAAVVVVVPSTLTVTGSYQPALSVVGSYQPTLEIVGTFESGD